MDSLEIDMPARVCNYGFCIFDYFAKAFRCFLKSLRKLVLCRTIIIVYNGPKTEIREKESAPNEDGKSVFDKPKEKAAEKNTVQRVGIDARNFDLCRQSAVREPVRVCGRGADRADV